MSATMTRVGAPPKVGRRPVSEIPSERRKHLTCLSLRRHYGARVSALAMLSEVSERRMWGWLKLAESYPEAGDPDYLRSLLAS